MFSWKFQALELLPNTSSVSGVIVDGRLRDVRLLQGWVQGRHLIVNELSERRTYTMDGEVLLIDSEQVGVNDQRTSVTALEKLVRVKRPRTPI